MPTAFVVIHPQACAVSVLMSALCLVCVRICACVCACAYVCLCVCERARVHVHPFVHFCLYVKEPAVQCSWAFEEPQVLCVWKGW